MDRASPAAARTRPRRRLRASTDGAGEAEQGDDGQDHGQLVEEVDQPLDGTRSLDWKSTKWGPLTAGTLSNTVMPLASRSFLAVISTWVRSMVIFPPLVLTEPVLVPVSTATSCLWEARLAATQSCWNLGDCTSFRVISYVAVWTPSVIGVTRNPAFVGEGVLHPLAQVGPGRPACR